jgi:molybdenum cofactor cytidylyltransferase
VASKSQPRVFAIVPAAGRSRRMGAAKQLLDVDGQPMLLSVLETLLASDLAGVMLVTHAAVARAIRNRKSRIQNSRRLFGALNEDERSEMIDSIRIGLRAWRERERIGDSDGFLVCPGDHPGITTGDHNACVVAFRETPDQIIIATRAGRRGHPIVFPASLADLVESSACDQGLHALPRTHADRVRLVACASPGVTRDMDTLADYEQLE